MLHLLTIGYLYPDAVRRRRTVVLRLLDMGVVGRLLRELGETDAAGRPTLGGCPVELHDGYVVCPWLMPSPVPAGVLGGAAWGGAVSLAERIGPC